MSVVAPKPEPAPAGLSARSLKLWLAAVQYRRRADELAVISDKVSQ
jgi:hypothetical protein